MEDLWQFTFDPCMTLPLVSWFESFVLPLHLKLYAILY